MTLDKLKAQLTDIEKKNEEISKKLIFAEKISHTNDQNDFCSKIRQRLKTSDLTSFENDEILSNYKNCFVKEKFLHKKNRLWIFDFDHLKLNAIRQIYDQIIVKHFDYVRIYRFIRECYYWSHMNRVIKKYIQNCYLCRRVKTSRDKYNEKLNFLSILKRNSKNIILNFADEFFRGFNRYNVILIIINRLSKKRYYISCDIENDEISVEIIVEILIQHVWKLHDLFLITFFDRKF